MKGLPSGDIKVSRLFTNKIIIIMILLIIIIIIIIITTIIIMIINIYIALSRLIHYSALQYLLHDQKIQISKRERNLITVENEIKI